MRFFLWCFLLGLLKLEAAPVPTPPVVHRAAGTGGAVASSHPLATQAGIQVLRVGGNAIDAAVGIGLMLGVVDGHNSGIGGGCFFLARLPDGSFLALDGREMAPAAAHRDLYLRADGTADTSASKTGARAPGVPGSLAVYEHVLRKHGTTELAGHLERAARVAEGGFPIDAKYAGRIKAESKALAEFAGKESPFFANGGKPIVKGGALRQLDLAASYRAIAKEGTAWFYSGAFASATEAWMEKNGGILTREDFARYRLQERKPLRTTYRGHEIVGFPPPSSGGTHVAQILNILENFDLKQASAADRTHLVVEAMKLAFADRAHWLGDADFVEVPVEGLVSKQYARELAARITPKRTSVVPDHGKPGGGDRKHTAHFTVVDGKGCWVACTATLNTSFGSKVMIPGTGILLNNQMDDFSIKPGVPNAFGLVGAEANAIAPGKRPLSSMSPTIVLREGKPVLTVGAAGGPTIITQALLTIVRTIDLGQPLLSAVQGPRFHHQWKPDQVQIERDLNQGLRASLQARGHLLKLRTVFGSSQAIALDPASGLFTAVSDPRAGGAAGCVIPMIRISW